MKAVDVVWIVVVSAILFFNWSWGGTVVIPERAQLYDVNEKYLRNASIIIKRYSRRSPYYVNAEGTTTIYAGDNVTIHCVYYEFLHNEYKRSFVEIDLKLCDLTNKSPWKEILGASAVLANKIICPAPPGTYRIQNLTAIMDNFHYVIPYEKAMVQSYVMFIPTQEIILRLRFYLTFKHTLPKKG